MATTAPSIQEKIAGPVKTPLTAPLPTSVPKEHPALTPDQKKKYDWLLTQVQVWTTIASKSAPGPLTDSERFWLTRDCLLRYLRATKWQEQEASKRLQETLAWRRDYGVESLTWEHISPENETGKQILLGFDNEGRPCHYLNPGRQNTDVSPRQTQHLVFMVERVIELMPAGQETLALLINFKTSKNRSNTAPGIGQGREVLNILQTHYPERLGKALIINGKFQCHSLTLALVLMRYSSVVGLGLLQAHNTIHRPAYAGEAGVQREHAAVRPRGTALDRVWRQSGV